MLRWGDLVKYPTTCSKNTGHCFCGYATEFHYDVLNNTAASIRRQNSTSLSGVINKSLLVNTNHYRLAQEQVTKDIDREFGEVLL